MEVVAEAPPKTEPPCPKLELWPKTGGLLWPKRPPPEPAEDCPKEKGPGLLVLDEAPKTLLLVDAGVGVADWPKAGTELNPGWLKEKPLAGLLVAWPKAGACPNAVWPKMAGPEAPKAGLPNPEVLTCGAVVAVLPVCCPNRLGAVLAVTCPNMGVLEGAVAVLLVSWLNAELALATGD